MLHRRHDEWRDVRGLPVTRLISDQISKTLFKHHLISKSPPITPQIMSLSDTLGIAGIAVSGLFGIWGVYLAVRKTKYPASLTFVGEQSVSLLEDFAQKIPNLNVSYKDIPIEKGVILLSGYVVNDGTLDITREMTEEPLTCKLPNGSKWLEFKVTTSAPSLHVSTEIIDEKNVKFNFGLFRRHESFSFQALALLGSEHTSVKATGFSEKLVWQHRIASLGEIKTVQMPAQSKRSRSFRWRRRGIIIIMAAIYIFMGFSNLTGIGPFGKQPSIIHTGAIEGRQTAIKLIANTDGTTTVKDLESGLSKKINLDSYTKSNALSPSWTDKRDSNWMTISLGAFMLISGAVFLFMGFGPDYRRRTLMKLVAASARET